ncbi:putative HVA22-like protein g isoform X1 [Salvia splendens]|uniref:putative HVA22-like protein g isoform X1 n=1 Tax=Salvia splendens TaxID=180675 RepID=UPI001C264030|nr:putative HVA22-like protein g isoform X1 [Salvia splendens]
MIEELITRSLILVFGYAYPAFQCFKTLEKNKITVPELRFWCQYWVIVALISILERVLDIFISWIPFYRGIKLLLYIYLWHPGTKGTTYMYDKAVQPYVSKHESTIDWGIAELKQRSWDLVLRYWYKSVDMSSKNVIQCLQLLMTQVMNAALSRPQAQEGQSKDDSASAAQENTPPGIFKRNVAEKPRPPGTAGGPTPKSDFIKGQVEGRQQQLKSK